VIVPTRAPSTLASIAACGLARTRAQIWTCRADRTEKVELLEVGPGCGIGTAGSSSDPSCSVWSVGTSVSSRST